MIWFTSDLHFGHNKDFVYARRGFDSIEEMNAGIIERYNSFVVPEDTVYILGDCMLKDNDVGMKCLSQLCGHKFLAIGNHDSDKRIELYRDSGIFEDIRVAYRMRYGKYSLWLSHYPMMMGNYKDKHPTWNLSGHTHNPDPFENGENGIYNVAVDAHGCYPVSLEVVINQIDTYRKEHQLKIEEKAQGKDEEFKLTHCGKCLHENFCEAKNNMLLSCPGYKIDPPDGGYYG